MSSARLGVSGIALLLSRAKRNPPRGTRGRFHRRLACCSIRVNRLTPVFGRCPGAYSGAPGMPWRGMLEGRKGWADRAAFIYNFPLRSLTFREFQRFSPT